MNVTLPGRGLVLMPQIDYVGVSRKITDEAVKRDLIDFIRANKPNGYGVILRTQSVDCSREELLQELRELSEKWEKIKRDHLAKPVCSLLYKEEDLAIRAVRDMLRDDVDRIVLNDRKLMDEFVKAFPYLLEKKPDLLSLYEGSEDMLKFYRLTEQIDMLLERKVVLKNGAYLIIDRTEALTVIDVNTGKYVGRQNLEETVFETNRIAAVEIARQLRLRNIGGIVVIDFIDMSDPAHNEAVLRVLQEELSKDRTKTSLVGMSSLGLVELTRKKKRSMIESVMLQPCPYCNGDGYVYSDEHVIGKIKNALHELFANPATRSVLLRVSPSVCNKMFSLRLMERECAGDWRDKRIYVVSDDRLHIEKFETKTLVGAILDLPSDARMLH